VRSDFHSGTTWAPKGKMPVVRMTGQRFSLNMIDPADKPETTASDRSIPIAPQAYRSTDGSWRLKVARAIGMLKLGTVACLGWHQGTCLCQPPAQCALVRARQQDREAAEEGSEAVAARGRAG
jgi:hypothetical protein